MSDTELAQKLEKAQIEDEEAFDLSAMKKKKKKSKKLALDDLEDNAEQPATKEPEAEIVEDGDVENTFANLKKKKKSKTVSFDVSILENATRIAAVECPSLKRITGIYNRMRRALTRRNQMHSTFRL